MSRNYCRASAPEAKLMEMEGIGFALAKIFSERSARHAGRPVGDLDTVSRDLQERGGLTAEEAEALLWGESLQLDLQKTRDLAEAFSLDSDLLGLLLRPTSREIVLHILYSFQSEMDPACDDCAFLQASLDEAPRMPRSELMQTCLDFLEHFSSAGSEEIAFAPGTSALLDVFSELDPQAQARVLAYAYSEAAGSVGDPMQEQSSAYARLRMNLAPLHRQVLDLLAEGSELSVRQIADRLHLRDARAVGQLPRSLQKLLRGDGAASPLEVRRTSGQSFYKLSAEALPLWQSLLRADATMQR